MADTDDIGFSALAFFEGKAMPKPNGRHIHRFNLVDTETGDVLLESSTMQAARDFAKMWGEAGSTYSYIETRTQLPSGHILEHKLASSYDIPQFNHSLVDVSQRDEWIAARVSDASARDILSARWAEIEAIAPAVLAAGPIAIDGDYSVSCPIVRLPDAYVLRMMNEYGISLPRRPLYSVITRVSCRKDNSWAALLGLGIVRYPDPAMGTAPSPDGTRTVHARTVPPRKVRNRPEDRYNAFPLEGYQAAIRSKGIAVVSIATAKVVAIGLEVEMRARLIPVEKCRHPRMSDGQCSFHFTYETADGRFMHYRSEARAAVDWRIISIVKNGSPIINIDPMMRACSFGNFDISVNTSFSVIDRTTGAVLAIGSQKQLMRWFSVARKYGYSFNAMKVVSNLNV